MIRESINNNDTGAEKPSAFVDKVLPPRSLRRGLFYIGVTVLLSYMAASKIAEDSSNQVANELKPTISQQGDQMRQSFDPAKENVERLALQGEEMFLSLCVAGLQMQSCPRILEENGINPEELPGGDETAARPPDITEIIPTDSVATTSTTAP